MGRKKKYVEDLIYPKDFVFRRADLSPRVIERAVALGADPFFLGVYVRALNAETLPVQLRGNAAKDYASGVHVVSSDPTKGSHRPSIREVETYLAHAIADVRGL